MALQFEAGFYFILLAFALFITFTPFKTEKVIKTGLRVLAMVLFFIISIYTVSGYQISMTTTSTQTIKNVATGDTWNENDTNTNIVLPGDVTSSWLGYLFMGFAMLNFFLAIRELLPNDKKEQNK